MSTSAENFHGLITRLQVVLSEIDYAQKACLQAGKMECQLLNHLFVVKTPVNMNELAKVLGVSHSRVTCHPASFRRRQTLLVCHHYRKG